MAENSKEENRSESKIECEKTEREKNIEANEK